MQHSENNSIIFDEMFKEGPEENQEREKFFIQFMNMLSTLALIIIFMLLAAWSLKRFLNQRSLNVNTDCEIRILEKRSLSPKSQLYLIETCDKKILIAESPSGVSLISQDLIARKVNENYPKENFS